MNEIPDTLMCLANEMRFSGFDKWADIAYAHADAWNIEVAELETRLDAAIELLRQLGLRLPRRSRD